MSSKLLKSGSELHGKSKGPADMGLKAKWAGASFGPDIIAPVSKQGRQYDAPDFGRKTQGAPKTHGYPAFSKKMDPSEFPGEVGSVVYSGKGGPGVGGGLRAKPTRPATVKGRK